MMAWTYLIILMATDRLARLHAVSYSFYKSHDFFHKYPSFTIDERWTNMMKLFLSSLTDCFIKAAEFKKEEYKMLFSTLESNKDALTEKLGDMPTNPKKLKIPCLAHGDYWTNNMMFQYDNDVSTDQMFPPHNIMMIDWGNTMFRDPLLDLQYLIYTSTTLSLRKQHLEEILHHYHSTFTTTTNDLGVRVNNWDFQDFMEDWNNTRYFGCIMGALNNILTLSKAGGKYQKQRGSISSNKFKAKIEIKLSKLLIGPMTKLFLHPSMQKVAVDMMLKPFKKIIMELESCDEKTQSRVFDLFNEAWQQGVFDV
ncbi:hypothetical protein Pmani_006878 [Petrolisthes manimaculis]|uniref:CHK kinase-like domain-containing protein n=1 Tax=Petrolisthes manimaculis TaxID=1843537 RepID=A0AAE1Q9L8_9EUCA|nr:hypothetical protein Pmani_006878 [Petrolisthes manimaculis]